MEAVADNRGGSTAIIALTMAAGMVLAVMPLPGSVPPELGYLRPDWVVMVLIYWIIALPHRVGIVTAWGTGLIVDVLLGSLLGQHALAYIVIAYVASSLYQRLRMFTVWQQALVVFAMLGMNRLIIFWTESIAGLAQWNMWYLLPAVSGALLWPVVFLMLRAMRRKLNVS